MKNNEISNALKDYIWAGDTNSFTNCWQKWRHMEDLQSVDQFKEYLDYAQLSGSKLMMYIIIDKIILRGLKQRNYDFLKQIMLHLGGDQEKIFSEDSHEKHLFTIHESIKSHLEKNEVLTPAFLKFLNWFFSDQDVMLGAWNVTHLIERADKNLQPILDIFQKNGVKIVIDRTIYVKAADDLAFIDCIKDLYSRELISESQKLSNCSYTKTLMKWACYNQKIDLLKHILKSLKKTNQLLPCIMLACEGGKSKSLDIVKLLVKKGREIDGKFDINQAFPDDRLLWGTGLREWRDVYATVLEHACHKGDLAVARYLISEGGDINWRLSQKRLKHYKNALLATITSDRPEKYDIAQFLLDNGIDIYTRSYPLSCLKYVMESGDERMLNILLQHPKVAVQLQQSSQGFRKLLFSKIINDFTLKKDIGVRVIKMILRQGMRKFSVFGKQKTMWSRFSYYFGSENTLLDLIANGLEIAFSGVSIDVDVSSLISAEIKEAQSLPCNHAEKNALKKKGEFLKQLRQMVYGSFQSKARRAKAFIVSEFNRQSGKKGKVYDKGHVQKHINSFRAHSKNVIKALYFRALYEKLTECKSQLLGEYLQNNIFDRRFLSPSLHFRLCVNKLGMWKAYQQGVNTMGEVQLWRRLGGETAKEEQVLDVIQKRVSEFLTYEDVQRLGDYSIVFGKFRMKAISKSAARPTSIEREPEQKKQRVNSIALPDWVTVHEDQNGCSSSKKERCA